MNNHGLQHIDELLTRSTAGISPAATGVSPKATRISFEKIGERRRHVFVPEGRATIAQRFNVGASATLIASPEGTAETIDDTSAVPSRLAALLARFPRFKPWAILNHPSGIKKRILVALGGVSPAKLIWEIFA